MHIDPGGDVPTWRHIEGRAIMPYIAESLLADERREFSEPFASEHTALCDNR